MFLSPPGERRIGRDGPAVPWAEAVEIGYISYLEEVPQIHPLHHRDPPARRVPGLVGSGNCCPEALMPQGLASGLQNPGPTESGER